MINLYRSAGTALCLQQKKDCQRHKVQIIHTSQSGTCILGWITQIIPVLYVGDKLLYRCQTWGQGARRTPPEPGMQFSCSWSMKAWSRWNSSRIVSRYKAISLRPDCSPGYLPPKQVPQAPASRDAIVRCPSKVRSRFCMLQYNLLWLRSSLKRSTPSQAVKGFKPRLPTWHWKTKQYHHVTE